MGSRSHDLVEKLTMYFLTVDCDSFNDEENSCSSYPSNKF